MNKRPLQLAIENSGEFRCRKYSGRGMYGSQCLGVEVNMDHSLGDLLGEIVAYVDDDNRDEISDALRKLRTDSLGLGEIVYFPGVPFTEEDDEELEDCEFCGAENGDKCASDCELATGD